VSAVEAAKSGPLSPGLDDVVKLTKAGVSETVILTFVQSSGVMYSPSAQDLIQLREAGVSPNVTTALIHRGSGLRQSALKSQQEAQAEAQARDQTAQPATGYAAATTHVTAPAASSTVTYIGAPAFFNYPVRYYGYPGYYSPGYRYPRYHGYYPRVALGYHFGGHYGYWR
jgi:hypothetical protein